MEIDVTQLHKLALDQAKYGATVVAGSRVLVQKACADTKRDGQALAPVDTGNLRSSIGYETRDTPTGARGEVGPTANYGAFVEDGTSRMGPQPYMGPAFDRNVQPYVKACEILAVKAAGQ